MFQYRVANFDEISLKDNSVSAHVMGACQHKFWWSSAPFKKAVCRLQLCSTFKDGSIKYGLNVNCVYCPPP